MAIQYGLNKVGYLYNEYVANLEVRGILYAVYTYGCYVGVDDAIVEEKFILARIKLNPKFLVFSS